MELFKLFGTIAVKTDEAEKSIDGTVKKAEASSSKLSSLCKKIGNGVKTIATIGLTATTAVATGIAAMTKSAVQSYAEYEQLVGGVETLFKDSSGKVVKYAENAYKTAGLSANEYMETVTSFSASLLASLGGDTEKAAEYADRAIVDMSDNANKMGSSMESIQNAYQGFAKQNYTMLDNLKLGYGGTKTEMQRLIADSAKLTKAQAELGVTVDANDMSFGNIVNAISVMQKEMGIAGTTSKEAATTISGSIGMMKSAWENFLTGMADPTQDFDALLGNLVDSVVTVADNIVPRIAETLPRIVKGLSGVIQSLAGYMPEIIGELLPALLEGAAALVGELASGIPELLSILIPTLLSSVNSILDTVIAALEGSGSRVAQAFAGAIEGIRGFVEWLTSGSVGAEVFTTAVLAVISAITAFKTAMAIQSLISSVSSAIEKAKVAFTAFHTVLLANPIAIVIAAIAALIAIGVSLYRNWDTVKKKCTELWNGLKTIWGNIKSSISQIVEAIKADLSGKWNSIKSNITSVVNGIKSMISSVFNSIKNTITSILNSVKSTFTSVWNGIKSTVTSAVNGVKSTISSGLNAAKSTVTSVLNAIKSKFSSIMNGAANVVSSAINKIKGFFNFSWSLPHIKLPHFSISGSFSLNPPSIPHFGVSWYKKAMDDPQILSDPAIFGFNPKTGKFLGGGEAGDEVVSGKDTLLNLIRESVANENGQVVQAIYDMFDKLFAIMEEYFPQFANMQLVTDTGALVGEIAPAMDEQLGEIQRRKERQ